MQSPNIIVSEVTKNKREAQPVLRQNGPFDFGAMVTKWCQATIFLSVRKLNI